MKRMDTRILILALAVSLAFTGRAANVIFSASASQTADWANTNNWAGSALPGPGDSVFIRGGRSASVTSDVGRVQRFYLGDSSSYGFTGTLVVAAGGKLAADAYDSYVGRSTTSNAVGWLYMTGGSLQIGDTNGCLTLTVGLDSPAKPIAGTAVISGGTVRCCFLVGSSSVDGALPDLLQVVGDTADIACTSNNPTGFYGLEVRQSGTLKWVFNATGASCLNYKGLRGKFNLNPKLIVDMAKYRGAPKTFKLLDCYSFDTTPSITLTNCPAGTTYNWNTASGDFTVTTLHAFPSGSLFEVR